ncbi:hypothetical protein F2Q68_00028006 [Brassica cretica]|uniref:F-box domain-containing protein n=1 Tax=Brassica cretica TaxID=69181 RepID=A0A8S9IBR1_BRACR|nr:hypothetical protein F2Q68_00028006 [Brassica cretica]
MDSAKTEQKKAAHEEHLPRELIEEILSRVSPKSLVRLRVVCKRWNSIMDDKRFINNHKETFRFIVRTESNIYSVTIDPKIVVRELTLDIPGLEFEKPKDVIDSDEFLICAMDEGAAVWNPWLKQSTWINKVHGFYFQGICYNGSNRNDASLYKTVWHNNTKWKFHNSASKTLEDDKFNYEIGVSLNGSLFWIAYLEKTDPLYCLVKVNFSKERSSRFCTLPCRMSHPRDAFVLRVFKGDRFSVLKQCHAEPYYYRQPSYFIDDKRLVVCSCDENGQAWIYVLGENKLISKVQLDSVVGFWPSHCTYFPSLVPVPRDQKNEAELQV